MTLKIEHINSAYSRMRISGITVQPTPEDVAKALERLEDMSAEYESRNICFNYNFEDEPSPNSVSGVERKHKAAIDSNLAVRLCADFGKTPLPTLMLEASQTLSSLAADTAQVRQVAPPSRQPVGSGNDLRYNRYQRFYRQASEAPISCETNRMIKGDVNDFVEHFDAYLLDAETIASYVLTADTGLTVVSESLASPDVDYRIQADGSTTGNQLDLEVKIVATTSIGRVVTRVISFQILEP